MKTFTSLGLVAAVVASTFAVCETHAAPDGLSLGIERAFGYALTSQTIEAGGMETTTDTSEFTLGLGSGGARVGIDYVTRSGLTLGTGIGYRTLSVESDAADTVAPTTSEFLIAPRVGSLMMFTGDVGLWPRGGLTYETGSVEFDNGTTTSEMSTSAWMLTLEAPLVIMPSSFGFSIAPTLDYVLSSTVEVEDNDADSEVSGYQFGISFGVFGIL
jgi:hypothetical protein